MKGSVLLRDSWQRWEEEGTALLLNPRLPGRWRSPALSAELPDLPNHIWLASSGSSGAFKLVALSRGALEASASAVNAHLEVTGDDCWINPLPLFHVGGLGIVVRAALAGVRCNFFPAWDAHEFVRCAISCGATLSSLVPAQLHDVVVAGLRCPAKLRAVVVGGGALDEALGSRARELGWPVLPSYGLTEAASQVATAVPGSPEFSWLPLLDHFDARVGEDSLLELRGPSLLTGWMLFKEDGTVLWEDPKMDGWFRTSDRCELLKGKLRVLGRLDDLVKIRGELVDVAMLERALQARVVSGLVRIDLEHDERNGVALVVVAENARAETEARGAVDLFPPYARPEFFCVGPVELTPLGKKIRPTR